MRRVLVLCLALVSVPALAGPESAYYADDTDGIFWFMHISDLHVSSNVLVASYPENLPWALAEGVTVVAPAFVVATGDLVDGSQLDLVPTSGQDQSEWDEYRTIYSNAGMTRTFYYDTIGNHDEYVLGSWQCPSVHWYVDNSLQGQANGAPHYSWNHTTSLGDYYFYALNMTGDCQTTRLPA